MKKIYSFYCFLFLCTISTAALCQNNKSLLKKGEDFKSNKKYQEAINAFSEVLISESNNFEAIYNRGQCYELSNNLPKALEDYKHALTVAPNNIEVQEKVADINLQLGNYKESINQYSTLTVNKKKSFIAYRQMAFAKIKIKDFTGALNDIDAALKIDNNDFNANFFKGIALDSMGSHENALKYYERAIKGLNKDKKYGESLNKSEYKFFYINPARTSAKLKQWDVSNQYFQKAESIAPNDFEIAFYKGETLLLKGDVNGAINEYNTAISLNPKSAQAYIERGNLFAQKAEWSNASSDFSRAIVLDDKQPYAYSGKAMVLANMNRVEEALDLYKKAISLAPEDKQIKSQFDAALVAYKTTHKESNKPELILQSPGVVDGSTVYYYTNNSSVVVKGRIKDESKISAITINSKTADYDKNNSNPEFSLLVDLKNTNLLNISIEDEFGNRAVYDYKVVAAENNQPVCELVIPKANKGKILLQTQNNMILVIEGLAKDESKIKSIRVNDKNASFDMTKLNPSFSTTINTTAIEFIEVVITDIFDNTSVTRYDIERDASSTDELNPMGKTWVVFIGNSNYNNFPSLETVSKDIVMVKNSLSGYIVDSIITRKNMTKQSMERFFSIELRDLIAQNKINSLLLWYSGHGLITNNNGYWIPTDASKKDEYSYFSTSNLKGYLSTYKSLKHTLVIADATETGPSFYLAMRDAYEPIQCGDYRAGKLKSAQVLSSAESQRTNESSLLSRVFSNSLLKTKDKCLSIEKISDQLNEVAKQNKIQKPKFGNIQDLTDENGTFFFLKKQE